MDDPTPNRASDRSRPFWPPSSSSWAAIGSATLLYLTGPTWNLWPLAFVALIPLAWISVGRIEFSKRAVYFALFAYYLIALQGLRHAHPLMVLPLIAMAGYLAAYPLLFAVLVRRWVAWEGGGERAAVRRRIPIALVAATVWVGGEWVRNHFLTGISVLMLGHSLVGMNPPVLIQIADAFGTYGVSFLLVVCNFAAAAWLAKWLPINETKATPQHESDSISPILETGASTAFAIALLCLATAYGTYRLRYETAASGTTFLLVGRDEQTEYDQDPQRAQDIFSAYASQTVDAVRRSDRVIDVVVWPESMFSGGMAWYVAEDGFVVPPSLSGTGQEEPITADRLRRMIDQMRADYEYRSENLQSLLKSPVQASPPSLIGGCGIVVYGDRPRQYSGVIHVDPQGTVKGTYAKNHLVMFGEYIPLVGSVPFISRFVPPGLGLDAGSAPAAFEIETVNVMPNLCIETAVERIAANHLREFYSQTGTSESMPQVIVTLTNDAWFDGTEVVAHHLRCARMVAIGCRRPILSAANGGPTAWIDSRGMIVEAIPFGDHGEILAEPGVDNRVSLYVRYGSFPAAIMGLAWILGLANLVIRKRSRLRQGDGA